MTNGFTPTQILMLGVLADGMPHRFDELHACLGDPLAEKKSIHPHISALRKKLGPMGHYIICEFAKRRKFYRHIRLLPSACGKPKV